MPSQCYGFNLATLTCTPGTVQVEKRRQQEEKGIKMMKFCALPSTFPEAVSEHQICDPEVCRLQSGICVDCTKCSNHCTCCDDSSPPHNHHRGQLSVDRGRSETVRRSATNASHSRRTLIPSWESFDSNETRYSTDRVRL